jgi:hypothetical protein
VPNVLSYNEWADLKQANHVNHDGYLDSSPNNTNPYNIIPSADITMDGVSRRLKLTPEKGDSIIAEPNSGSYNFGDSSWVLEIPQD